MRDVEFTGCATAKQSLRHMLPGSGTAGVPVQDRREWEHESAIIHLMNVIAKY
jgi:hypothetical protein